MATHHCRTIELEHTYELISAINIHKHIHIHDHVPIMVLLVISTSIYIHYTQSESQRSHTPKVPIVLIPHLNKNCICRYRSLPAANVPYIHVYAITEVCRPQTKHILIGVCWSSNHITTIIQFTKWGTPNRITLPPQCGTILVKGMIHGV